MKAHRIGATVCVTLGLLLAGCGEASLSTGQLRTQATLICQAADRQAAHVATPNSPTQAQAFLSGGVTVVRAELARLRGLSPSTSAVRVYHSALTGLARQLVLLKATVRDLRAGGDAVTAVKMLQQELGPPQSQADAAWRELGITACTTR